MVSSSSTWSDDFVLGKVLECRLAAGNPPGAVFVGLYPQTAPSSLNSLGGGGAAMVRAGSAKTLAHEVGHALGLGHAPCAMPAGAADPAFPAYEPYEPSGYRVASIGEYGWDVMTRQIHDPHVDHDFMGYCIDPWISIYHYVKLSNASGISSAAVQPWGSGHALRLAAPGASFIQTNGPEPGESRDHLYVLGAIDRGERVELHSVRRVHGHPAPVGIYETPYRVVVEDADRRTLAMVNISCDMSPEAGLLPLPFAVSLPASGDAARIVVERDGEPIISLDAPRHAPELEITDLSVNDGHLRVRWRASHAEAPDMTYWVRFSGDGGETWRALSVDAADGEFDTPVAGMPGGGSCVIEVVAHDGFHSVYRASEPFELPLQPPVARIIAPRPEEELSSNRDVLLSAAAFSPQEGPLPNEALVWSSNRDGELGSGGRLVIDELSAGRHLLRVTATDARGERSAAEVEIDVPPNGHRAGSSAQTGGHPR
jgi:Peptidase M66